MLEYNTEDGIIVEIRPTRLDDAPSLQRSCLPANTLDEVKNFLKRDAEEMTKGNMVRLVAVVGGEAVGNMEIYFSRHPLTSHTAEITTVVVNPKFRMKGIAMKMLEYCLKIAKERNIEIVKIYVEAKNIPAARLYAKAGFKEYGRLERGLMRGGKYDDEILLKKDL